jgi:hypothetical protein
MSHPIPPDAQRLVARLRLLADEIESAARYGVPIPFMVSANGHEFGNASFHLDPGEFDTWVDYTFGGDENAAGRDYEMDGDNWSSASVDVNGLPLSFATCRGKAQVSA